MRVALILCSLQQSLHVRLSGPTGPHPARGAFTRVRVLAFTRLRVVSGGAAPKCEGLLCLDQKPLVINDATLPSTDSKVE